MKHSSSLVEVFSKQITARPSFFLFVNTAEPWECFSKTWNVLNCWTLVLEYSIASCQISWNVVPNYRKLSVACLDSMYLVMMLLDVWHECHETQQSSRHWKSIAFKTIGMYWSSSSAHQQNGVECFGLNSNAYICMSKAPLIYYSYACTCVHPSYVVLYTQSRAKGT